MVLKEWAAAGPPRPTIPEARRRELEAALRSAVRGEVEFDSGTRAIYATDSSNYRHVPLGVVFPRDHADVVAIMHVCAAHVAPVVTRSGMTSPLAPP